MKSIIRITFFASLAFAWTSTAAPETSVYRETKAVVTQWAETEQLISKERNDWKKDKAILEDLVKMLEDEKSSLVEKIDLAKASATESDSRRAEVLARKDSLEESSRLVRDNLESLEDSVREVVPYLPEKYKESIAPLLRQLPKKGQATELSTSIRLRNVVGILSQANKFDNVVSLESETRSFAEGISKQVTTLYFGFAIAYYADANGENAGYGVPSADGWVWKASPDYAESIVKAISMYQKGQQAEFVSLPISIN